MIISHKFKFIFIRVPKTASTALQLVLGKMCGENDIVTSESKDMLEQMIKLGFKPKNYEGFKPHISAREIKKKISPKIWDSYFKFCFIRNPFDRIVSRYSRRKANGKFFGDFNDYCLEASKGRQPFPVGYEMITIDDKIAVDFIGRYESLQKDFNHVCKKLKLPFEGELPILRGDIRKNDQHYSTYYDSMSKEIVQNHYAKEIEIFGYKFEDE